MGAARILRRATPLGIEIGQVGVLHGRNARERLYSDLAQPPAYVLKGSAYHGCDRLAWRQANHMLHEEITSIFAEFRNHFSGSAIAQERKRLPKPLTD